MKSFHSSDCFQIETIKVTTSKAAKETSPIDNGIFRK